MAFSGQEARQIRSMASDFAVSEVIPLFERAERQLEPAKPFVVGPRTLTYGALRDQARRLSTLFRQLELRRDDRAIVATGDDIAVSGCRVSEDRQERPLELDVGCLNRFEVSKPNP